MRNQDFEAAISIDVAAGHPRPAAIRFTRIPSIDSDPLAIDVLEQPVGLVHVIDENLFVAAVIKVGANDISCGTRAAEVWRCDIQEGAQHIEDPKTMLILPVRRNNPKFGPSPGRKDGGSPAVRAFIGDAKVACNIANCACRDIEKQQVRSIFSGCEEVGMRWW